MNEFMKFESYEVYNHTSKTSPSYGKLKMLETFEELIVDNRTTYTLRGSASKDHKLAQTSFAQRQAAMIPNGNWIENESLQGMTDEVRMMHTPLVDGCLTDENGNPVRYNYSGQPDYMIIPAQAKNIEGAKKFLAFCCKDEMLKKYTSLTGTHRPFAYDISECETSEFIQSCLAIWGESETWFESSTSKLWTANKAKKYFVNNPYATLLADDTITAMGWCATEYKQVKAVWNTWLEAIA
jgi:ABC-type glycerol-3-phosphate transport system substrate-binding protein